MLQVLLPTLWILQLRLCIHLMLCSEWESIAAYFAIVCSSWVPVNRGSTGRSIMTPLGNEDFIPVRKANKMTSRNLETCYSSVLWLLCIFMTGFQSSKPWLNVFKINTNLRLVNLEYVLTPNAHIQPSLSWVFQVRRVWLIYVNPQSNVLVFDTVLVLLGSMFHHCKERPTNVDGNSDGRGIHNGEPTRLFGCHASAVQLDGQALAWGRNPGCSVALATGQWGSG